MDSIKRCRVCGGLASGFNYDALTCESCKLFFFRNSARLETLECNYNGDCEIYSSMPKKCTKCRLVKCFAIGMKRKCYTKTAIANIGTLPVEDGTVRGIELFLEISIRKRICQGDIQQITDYVHDQYSNFQEMPKKRFPVKLNSYELERIAEAQQAISIFRYENTANVIRDANNVAELLQSPVATNLLYPKKIINFCLNFAPFNSLSSEGQLSVLRSFGLTLMTIWFAFQYRPEKGGVLMFTDESETEAIFFSDQLGACERNQKMVNSISQYALALHKSLENDVAIRDLIAALVLFKSQTLSYNTENFKYYYCLYSLILKRYLQYKYRNRKAGSKKYLSLMRILDKLEQHQEYKKKLALEFGLENCPQIVREVLELD